MKRRRVIRLVVVITGLFLEGLKEEKLGGEEGLLMEKT